jgi:hypothetical protein
MNNRYIKEINFKKLGFSSKGGGTHALICALRVHPGLENIYVNDNEFGDAQIIELAKILKENKKWIALGIANTGFGQVGIAAIADALKVNRTVDFGELGYGFK